MTVTVTVMKKLIPFLCLLCWMAGEARAQNPDGPPVAISEGSPPVGWEVVLCYDGVCGATGTDLTALCYARSTLTTGLRAATKVAISAVSKASAAVVTSTGHGFPISARPIVTISGATGTGWTGINATWTATVIDANTFSIPINSTTFGTLGGTVVFTTTAPRTTQAEWAVQKLVYDTHTLIWKGWLNGSSGLQAKCSDATSTAVTQQ